MNIKSVQSVNENIFNIFKCIKIAQKHLSFENLQSHDNLTSK